MLANDYLFLNNFRKRELNLMAKYVTFNHCNMSSNLIALIIKL